MHLWKLTLMGALLVAAILFVVADEQPAGANGDAVSGRKSFRLTSVFDFDKFKRTFGKQYASLAEELARKKLFLARCFRAFLSKIGYKHGKSSSYLSTNQMSDLTNDELASMVTSAATMKADLAAMAAESEELRAQLAAVEELRALPMEQRERIVVSQPAAAPSGLPAVDEEVLERSLEDIVSRASDRPGYREIAAELSQPSHANELEGDERPQEPARLARPRTNNPNYQPPELDSTGVGDWLVRLMPEGLLRLLQKLSGGKLVKELVEFTVSKFALLKGKAEVRKVTMEISWQTSGTQPIDLRESRCFGPIKDQGACGSCYIFAPMALAEFVHCKRTGQRVSFSEQFALDCGGRAGLKGCAGGHTFRVAKFSQQFGLELSANYPYRRMAFHCPYETDTEPSAMGYLKLAEGALELIPLFAIEKYLSSQPLLMDIYTPRGFLEYGGGVDEATSCANSTGAHSMLLVGQGVEEGEPFWLLRNSYGPIWGDRGHYKLSKRVNCFTSNFVLASAALLFDEEFASANQHYEGAAVARRARQHIAALLLSEAKHQLASGARRGLEALEGLRARIPAAAEAAELAFKSRFAHSDS